MARIAPNERVGIGLIGCGYAAETLHLPALRHVPEARVIALADPDAVRVASMADRFDIGGRHADYKSMLDDPLVEAVAVCAPTEFHAGIAAACLQAGKHVLVEKPVATRLDDIDALERHAAARGLVVAVGFNLRHNANIREARRIVASGGVGPVEAVRSVWSSNIRHGLGLPRWRTERARGGGALFEIGSHVVDLWRFVIGTEIDTVHATTRSEDGDDQTVAMSARLSSGALASAVLSQRAFDRNEFEIIGRTGSISVSPYSFAGLDYRRGASLSGRPAAKLAKIAGLARAFPGALAMASRNGSFRESYRQEWRQFLTSIRRGGQVGANLDDGRKALAAIAAMIRSIDQGREIAVARSLADPQGAPAVNGDEL